MHDITIESVTNGDARIKVWDLPIRLFHWALVGGFIAAYLSAKYHFGDLHVLAGYAVCVLLVARMIWGVVGGKYARFDSFIFTSNETLAYLRAMLRGNPRHYLGHNPAGALMVFTLLVLLALIFVTGMITLAVIDFDGPLLAVATYFNDETSYAFRRLHETLVNVGLVLVILHVAGVIWGSIQHKENLIRAMFTGYKFVPTHSESDSDINQ